MDIDVLIALQPLALPYKNHTLPSQLTPPRPPASLFPQFLDIPLNIHKPLVKCQTAWIRQCARGRHFLPAEDGFQGRFDFFGVNGNLRVLASKNERREEGDRRGEGGRGKKGKDVPGFQGFRIQKLGRVSCLDWLRFEILYARRGKV